MLSHSYNFTCSLFITSSRSTRSRNISVISKQVELEFIRDIRKDHLYKSRTAGDLELNPGGTPRVTVVISELVPLI